MGSAAKIMKASIFFLVLASASAAPQFEGLKDILEALSGDQEPGEVNGDYEQVPYTTLKKYDGYEMRQYPSVNWACTEATYQGEEEEEDGPSAGEGNQWEIIKMIQEMMSSKSWKDKPENKMFMKLFRYISGVNKQSEEIEMTVPVLTRMKLLEGNMINKQMCFYLNKEHQTNPPTPVDPEVTIETNKELVVYVHTFGGYAMRDAVNIKQSRIFAEVLNEAGENVDANTFFAAGYDSPMKFWNRRNEVMFVVPDNTV